MSTAQRALQVATTLSFVGLVVMSLVLETSELDVATHTDVYLGFVALGVVSLVLAWFAFADVRREE